MPSSFFKMRYIVCMSIVLVLLVCLISVRQIKHINTTPAILPVAWQPYSEDIKDAALMDGRKVLVFLFAELNPESAVALERIDSAVLSELCENKACETLLLRYSNWDDPQIRSIWKDVGHTKNPLLVVYSPNKAPFAFHPFSLTETSTESRSQLK
jgi:hypothetical protein